MNKVILMGRLTRDPEIRWTTEQEAKAIGRFSLAVDRKTKRDNQPTADFFNCVAFGKLGEFTEKYLKKGTKILLIGELHNDNYTDKNGNQQYSVQIIVNEMEFAESKSSSGASETSSTPETDNNGFMNIPDGIMEELPFT